MSRSKPMNCVLDGGTKCDAYCMRLEHRHHAANHLHAG